MRINVSSSLASSALAIVTLVGAAAANATPIAFSDQARLQQRDVMTAPSVSYQSTAPIGSSDRARTLVHASKVAHQSDSATMHVPGSTDEARELRAAGFGAAQVGSLQSSATAS